MKTTKPYFICLRCNINSLDKISMCPCPRGSCEALHTGNITTETKLKLFKTPKPCK